MYGPSCSMASHVMTNRITLNPYPLILSRCSSASSKGKGRPTKLTWSPSKKFSRVWDEFGLTGCFESPPTLIPLKFKKLQILIVTPVLYMHTVRGGLWSATRQHELVHRPNGFFAWQFANLRRQVQVKLQRPSLFSFLPSSLRDSQLGKPHRKNNILLKPLTGGVLPHIICCGYGNRGKSSKLWSTRECYPPVTCGKVW